MNYIAQLFGFSAIGISFLVYSRKKRRHILICKLLQDIFWMLHYFLLGTYSAAVTNMICATREILFFSESPRISKTKTITFTFIAFYLVSAILTWKNVYSIFPALSSTFSAIAFSFKKPIYTKLIAIPSSLCTLVYNITTSHSVSVYVGITISLGTLCFSLVETALIPYIRQKKSGNS